MTLTQTLNLPVLSLTDQVVLPGMVVPVELDEKAQAVIDAARAGSDSQLLLAPRLDDRYAPFGTVARIGHGVPGPGTALGVQAELVEDVPATERAHELAAEYRALVVGVLERRN